MDYLIRLVQVHESFREAEVRALAHLASIDLEIIEYSEYVCLCYAARRRITTLSIPRGRDTGYTNSSIVSILHCPT